MRLTKALAAGLLLSFATPATAQEIIGEGGVFYEYFNNPDFPYKENDIELYGSVLFRGANGLNLQLSGLAGYGRWEYWDGASNNWFGSVNVDAYFANPVFAAGIYGGFQGCQSCGGEINYWAGVEAVGFFNGFDLGGGGGFLSNWGGDPVPEVWTFANTWLTPNHMVGIALFWEGDDEESTYGVEVRGERRFDGTNLGLWLSGGLSHYECCDWSFGQVNAQVGLTFYADQPGTTLMEHRRKMPF